MITDYFLLEKSPFSLTPDTNFFCEFDTYSEAIELIQYCLASGESFVKIVGEVGAGKTLLCNKILTLVDPSYIVLHISNSDVSPDSFYKLVASALKITNIKTEVCLHNQIKKKIQSLKKKKKKFLIIVDEVQAMPDTTLESLRLLTNIETEQEKLIFIILIGQPEIDERLSSPHLRQLRQRIAVSHYLKPLNASEVNGYITKRLIVAGHNHGTIFTDKAKRFLYKISKGTPRILNIISQKSMMVAYNQSKKEVTLAHVKIAAKESRDIINTVGNKRLNFNFSSCVIAIEILFALMLLLIVIKFLFPF